MSMFPKKRKPEDLPNTMAKPKNKTVNVTVSFEMDERTAKLFLQSSIERVINESVRIVELNLKDDDTGVNLEDWQEWKPIVVTMWNAMNDAIFRFFREMPSSDTTFTLRKGD